MRRLRLPVLRSSPVNVGLVTLGCDKNTVDSERLLGRLAAAGARVSGEVCDADVVVVNTCGFIGAAKEESIEAILDATKLKEAGKVRAVVAVGCLVQRYRAELEAEIPGVDLFLGLTEVTGLVPELRARGLLAGQSSTATMERPLRILSTETRHTSYLKVSEGCDHTCAFCAIPLMRGKHRSTPIPDLVAEARDLEGGGVVELNLISQDTTWYGRDLVRGTNGAGEDFFVGKRFAGMAGVPTEAIGRQAAGSANVAGGLSRDTHVPRGMRSNGRPLGQGDASRHGLLPDLLRGLLDGTDIPWFRLFYMYPSGIHRALVELIAEEPRILPYLDMPIQHGADTALKRMRRPERQATIRERVAWLRDAISDLSLRTTVIVGFPGETEDEFEALLELLEDIRFDHLGAFGYSPEENTRAVEMPDQVPESLKRERLERLLDVQRAITLEKNEAWIGREAVVLIDEVEGDDEARGRTAGQAIEVDSVVRLSGAGGVRPGEFVSVRIEHAWEEVLEGVVLAPAASQQTSEPTTQNDANQGA